MELQNQIFDKTRKITQILKSSEIDLKRLANSDSESKSDEQIKQNIMTTLAAKLQKLTSEFKSNEKNHYIKVKDFHGDDDIQKKKQKNYQKPNRPWPLL